ncbi:hypothetical protein [Thioalkalivibrio sp. ALgr3]|uniref:hypothetical protein n=1 Tax=Thioalkalivibrio sp. ALgr3 TaxID=1239292 RepID=UPI0012DEC167|nr:hypothetical protein [Thioalkalivibrio sp. ALgr3]
MIVTLRRDGQTETKEIKAPGLAEARNLAATDYPDAEIVSVEKASGEGGSKTGGTYEGPASSSVDVGPTGKHQEQSEASVQAHAGGEHVEGKAAGSTSLPSGNGNDSVTDLLYSRNLLGPALAVIGLVVIGIGIIAGLVNAANLPDRADGLTVMAAMLSVWLYTLVSGLLILGVGAMVTYLFRIQSMMARDRRG